MRPGLYGRRMWDWGANWRRMGGDLAAALRSAEMLFSLVDWLLP